MFSTGQPNNGIAIWSNQPISTTAVIFQNHLPINIVTGRSFGGGVNIVPAGMTVERGKSCPNMMSWTTKPHNWDFVKSPIFYDDVDNLITITIKKLTFILIH